MKVRVSASIEKETDSILDKIMETGKYRNKSHAIEKAIILLEKEEEKRERKKQRRSEEEMKRLLNNDNFILSIDNKILT